MSDTALLIFCNTPEREALVKSLHQGLGNGKPQGVELAKALLNRVRSIARQSQLPVIEIDSNHQVGQSFGERYSQAIAQVFARGYQKVITLGSDCPGLTLQDLREAEAALQNHAGVIGPAKDGGAYLIGLRKSAFDEAQWKTLAWQTSQNFRGLRNYFGKLDGGFYTLARYYADLDRGKDLSHLLKELSSAHSFYRTVCALRAETTSSFFLAPLAWASLAQHPWRGPPLTL
ncbi:MAG: DUF2064 domain-containing protein [Microscillaceae bacterium]|nr:DUF2064 domain-containing protein [Microscillaceae bacterium]